MSGRIYSLALIAAIIGCHSKSKLDDVGKGAPAGVVASGSNASDDKDAPKRAPVTAASLQPIIHELGRDNELPTSRSRSSTKAASAASAPNRSSRSRRKPPAG
jgi:hypothetical protein